MRVALYREALCRGLTVVSHKGGSRISFRPLNADNIEIWMWMYEGHLESKERFAIQRYLLIIGKKKNMQVL